MYRVDEQDERMMSTRRKRMCIVAKEKQIREEEE